MYVIADGGHAVINGLNQIKVFESREDAEQAWIGIVSTYGDRGFKVQEVHFVKEGE